MSKEEFIINNIDKLRNYHAKKFQYVCDDDLPDAFDSWVGEQTVEELKGYVLLNGIIN